MIPELNTIKPFRFLFKIYLVFTTSGSTKALCSTSGDESFASEIGVSAVFGCIEQKSDLSVVKKFFQMLDTR